MLQKQSIVQKFNVIKKYWQKEKEKYDCYFLISAKNTIIRSYLTSAREQKKKVSKQNHIEHSQYQKEIYSLMDRL